MHMLKIDNWFKFLLSEKPSCMITESCLFGNVVT